MHNLYVTNKTSNIELYSFTYTCLYIHAFGIIFCIVRIRKKPPVMYLLSKYNKIIVKCVINYLQERSSV